MAYSTTSLPNDTPQVAKMHSLTYCQIMPKGDFVFHSSYEINYNSRLALRKYIVQHLSVVHYYVMQCIQEIMCTVMYVIFFRLFYKISGNNVVQ